MFLFIVMLYISHSGLNPGIPLGIVFFKRIFIFVLLFFPFVKTFQYFIEILLIVVCFYLIVDTVFGTSTTHVCHITSNIIMFSEYA